MHLISLLKVSNYIYAKTFNFNILISYIFSKGNYILQQINERL